VILFWDEFSMTL